MNPSLKQRISGILKAICLVHKDFKYLVMIECRKWRNDQKD